MQPHNEYNYVEFAGSGVYPGNRIFFVSKYHLHRIYRSLVITICVEIAVLLRDGRTASISAASRGRGCL